MPIIKIVEAQDKTPIVHKHMVTNEIALHYVAEGMDPITIA